MPKKKPTWKSDIARNETDALLDDLEKRIKKEYSKAYEEIKAKADNYFQKFSEADAEKLAQLKANEITEQQYLQWRANQMLSDKRYKELLDTISRDCVNADKLAMQMVNDMLPDVFALNANYAAFQLEQMTGIDTNFTLYDKKAASLLMKSDPDLLPIKSTLKIPEDLRWNKRKLDSAILQGVLQGNSIPDIADRLQNVIGMDSNSAIRSARTMTTSAENAGRYDSYEHAADAGIPVKVMWMATPDDRTRESHRELDGEEIELGGTFKNGCKFPGDPAGEPEEVYNCRCRLQRIVPGSFFASKFHKERENTTIEGMSYEEWKRSKQEVPEPQQTPAFHVVQGTDISSTWQRRPDQFDFEIDDVINAQGFDGLPTIVSADEFDKYVQEGGIYCQRVYGAEDKETLEEYQKMLYEGKWYVNCANGGSAYGQGMYCGTGMGELHETKALAGVMNAYADAQYNIIETFTLAKDANTISSHELGSKWIKLTTEEMARYGNDKGVYAASLGYDAITHCGRKEYAVILNRTACIFKEGTTIQGFEEIHDHWMSFRG